MFPQLPKTDEATQLIVLNNLKNIKIGSSVSVILCNQTTVKGILKEFNSKDIILMDVTFVETNVFRPMISFRINQISEVSIDKLD